MKLKYKTGGEGRNVLNRYGCFDQVLPED